MYHNVAPLEVTELFEFVRSDRTRRLMIKRCKGVMGSRAISVCGPKLWNALPLVLRVETSTEKFKKCLKTFLFNDVHRFYEIVYSK